MKRWTVMLIPQDRGGTQTFSLAAYHFWVAIGLSIGLSTILAFFSAFFFQRHYVIAKQATELQEQNKTMKYTLDATQTAPAVVTETTGEDVEAVERRLRADYEASIDAITAELSELYDMEAKARDITGIAPREKSRDTESQTCRWWAESLSPFGRRGAWLSGKRRMAAEWFRPSGGSFLRHGRSINPMRSCWDGA